MIHSASLRATGSVIDFNATSLTASLPLRVASITCLTNAMSAAEVAGVGAIANGPEAGRANGLNVARLANKEPRKPTLAWANADRQGLSFAGCLAGNCTVLGGASVAASGGINPGAAGFWAAGSFAETIAGRD